MIRTAEPLGKLPRRISTSMDCFGSAQFTQDIESSPRRVPPSFLQAREIFYFRFESPPEQHQHYEMENFFWLECAFPIFSRASRSTVVAN